MAFDRKLNALRALRPDVAVISECAKPEVIRRKAPELAPSSAAWVGDNTNKGLGVFAFDQYRVSLHPIHDPSIRFVAPVLVEGPVSFNLIGVWARHDKRPANDTNPPVLRAITKYEGVIRSSPTVIGGDFNNNVCWDRTGKACNHMNAVDRLTEMGLFSAYHHSRGVAQGNEPEPTHYWRERKKDGWTYHIDYCFLPNAWMLKLKSVEVGSHEDWVENSHSDHVPIVVDLAPWGS